MWTNLLNGAIGAVIGVVGAFIAAVVTVRLTRREDAQRARAEFALRVSGELAASLVELYDALRRLTPRSTADDTSIELDRVHDPAEALRRAITVDAPLLPGDREEKLKDVRHTIAQKVPRHASHSTAGELRDLLRELKPAGDRLRDLRRDWYQAAPDGMSRRRTQMRGAR